MRVATRILLAFVAAIASIVLFAWLHASSNRRADASYHAGLAKTLSVTSSSFPANGDIPAPFTCRGAGQSPAVDWNGGPVNVRSYVVVMTDFDVPLPGIELYSFTHWVVYNIPGNQQTIQQAVRDGELRRTGIDVGTNSAGIHEYQPPCPPLGRHRYTLRVYALDVSRLRPMPDDAEGVLDSMRGHIIAYGELVGQSAR